MKKYRFKAIRAMAYIEPVASMAVIKPTNWHDTSPKVHFPVTRTSGRNTNMQRDIISSKALKEAT